MVTIVQLVRASLGIEVPIEKIPGIQRMIIHKCMRAKKPVIVATQMLHTMINNPRRTRAEVTDIANASLHIVGALQKQQIPHIPCEIIDKLRQDVYKRQASGFRPLCNIPHCCLP